MGVDDKKMRKNHYYKKNENFEKISNFTETVLNIRININLQNLKILKFDRVR